MIEKKKKKKKKHFFFFFRLDGKGIKLLKKTNLTSNRHAKHLLAGQNTQHVLSQTCYSIRYKAHFGRNQKGLVFIIKTFSH